MSNRFIKQSQCAIVGIFATAALMGLGACSDDYDLDEKGNNPSWLGKSIYEELENPKGALTGTFHTYLKLIDDLGYKEVMSKTGSKTVFVANDSAYNEFFKNNSWGVSSYDQLTESMKKQLFYASMLDNAILTEALSNVDDGQGGLSRGVALKHQTAANATDTIYHVWMSNLPKNNSYWEKYREHGIDVVMDNTRPMLVHFTQEQMLNNSINANDFQIITGKPYEERATFIFKNKVIAQDVTCLNGYINQMDGVILPPGNLAKVIREGSDTKWFSRMMDRFSAPYYDAVTTLNYNDNAVLNGRPVIDSIFQWRYFSERSQSALPLLRDPKGVTVANDKLLRFDPGWNQYYSAFGVNLADMGSMFVPTDKAVQDYFLNPSSGGYNIISLYAKKPNTLENLGENIDSIPNNIISSFVNNMMNTSFVQSVPSKFGTILDEASDPIGITASDIVNAADGSKDVRVANNGVIYMLDRVVPPITYNIVSTPASLRGNMDLSVINWAIQSKQASSNDKDNLNINFFAYLRASTANYALFLPNNKAFDAYYLDPVSLGKNNGSGNGRARLYHFYKKAGDNNISASYFNYTIATGAVSKDSTRVTRLSDIHDRLIDILNYHTVSLNAGESLGSNKYYKTKHGGEIRITGTAGLDDEVMSGAQINGLGTSRDEKMPAAKITETPSVYSNGKSYIIDHLIQAPVISVNGCLEGHSQFSDFVNMCMLPNNINEIFKWLGITNVRDQNQFRVFTDDVNDCIDYNISFFNSYNYTVYAPNNEAMRAAHKEKGLPSWDDLTQLMEENQHVDAETAAAAKAKGLAMLEAIRNFVRYHFQDYSIYADNKLDYGDAPTENGGRVYQTSCNINGVYQKLNVSGGNNVMTVKDNADNAVHINAASTGKVTNFMTRDYVFSGSRNTGKIETSSFAVVHEIGTPLCYDKSGRYDAAWKSNSPADKQRLAQHRAAVLKAQSKGVQYYK